jgi:hypothetical protein
MDNLMWLESELMKILHVNGLLDCTLQLIFSSLSEIQQCVLK